MWKKGKNKENFVWEMEIWQENSANRWLDDLGNILEVASSCKRT